MLTALLDGHALPAGELAYVAGVTAQTASAHLAKLRDGDLVAVEKEGRHRYYRLAGPSVAEALERLSTIRHQQPARRKPFSAKARKLRYARCCYNHLAGQLGIAVAQSLQMHEFILAAPDKTFDVTPAGVEWLAGIGLDVCALRPARRGLARQCLDWTERRHHLAGPLGVELLRVLCANGWLRRVTGSRLVHVTSTGRRELKWQLGIDVARSGPNRSARGG